MKAVTLLGSTGSIGVSTLDVLARHPDEYQVYALTANKSVDKLLLQCRQFEPEIAVMLDEKSAELLAKRLKVEGLNTQVLAGSKALEQVAEISNVDYVVAAIVGAANIWRNAFDTPEQLYTDGIAFIRAALAQWGNQAML